MSSVERHTKCPFCGAKNDRSTCASRLENIEPEDGDLSLCAQCGKFSIYDSAAEGGVRKPSAEEHSEFITLPEVQMALSFWQEFVGKKKGPLQ